MTDHLSSEQLQQLLTGQPGDEYGPGLLEHVNACAVCAASLESLTADPLLEQWRQLLRPERFAPLSEVLRRQLIQSGIPEVAALTRDEATTDGLPKFPKQSAAALLEGRALGKYRLLRLLGKGGMGEVYEAEDERLRRRVAVKVMRADLAESREARERFLREARAAAALQHDHVVPVFEADEVDDLPYLVMQLLEGETLEARLRREPRLTVAEILQVGREAAAGLAAAHSRNLIHRDIKPANLFLERLTDTQHFRVRLLDFGLARAQDGRDGVTEVGRLCGTLQYMSPEQVEDNPLDDRSDLFSLGVVLYLLAVGDLPFQGKNPAALAWAVAKSEPVAPHVRNQTIPAELSRLILQLLAKNPSLRPASAAALVEAFRALESASPVEASTVTFIRAGEWSAVPRLEVGGRRWLLAGAMLALMTVAAVVLLILFPPWKEQEPEKAGPLSLLPNEKVTDKSLPIPMKGFLDIRVTEPGNPLRQKLMLHQPLALPLKKGMKMDIEAEVDRPAYLYLIYLDSNGEATPLFPWKDNDWKKRPAAEERRVQYTYYGDLDPSPTGVESLLLLVRDERLPDDVDLSALFKGLPKQKGLRNLRTRAWFQNGEVVAHDRDRGRPVGIAADDPVGQTQALLRGRLKQLFLYTRAVCFAFQGD